MTLEPLNVNPVEPGQPITAQAWNQIVDNLKAVISAVNSQAGQGVRVTLDNTDLDLSEVKVSAVAKGEGGAVFQAASPVAPDTSFVLTGLPPGAYVIHASAPGYDTPATESVDVPGTDEVTLKLTGGAPEMPEIFGDALDEALAKLRSADVPVAQIFDITGQPVPATSGGAEFGKSKVLMHFPDSGEPVTNKLGVKLVVSAALEVKPSVVMPNLAGLSLTEVRRVLDDLGLSLGEVSTRTDGRR